MYGTNKIQGNGRIVQMFPKLAINVTVLEDDLLDYVIDDNDKIHFRLKKREKPDRYSNHFFLITDNHYEIDSDQNIALVSTRNPVMVIDIILQRDIILSDEFQELKNASGFIKFHLFEEETVESHFKILPGYFNYKSEEN